MEEEGKEREGEWRGGKGRALQVTVEPGPSEPCYATGCCHSQLTLGLDAYRHSFV